MSNKNLGSPPSIRKLLHKNFSAAAPLGEIPHAEWMIDLTSLPQSLLSAERLNGTVVRLGGSYAPLMHSQGIGARIRCALPAPQVGVICSGLTAAWVWGAVRDAPEVQEYSVRAESRVGVHVDQPHVRRELQFLAGEVHTMQQREVTSPLRTVFDLMQMQANFTSSLRVACRLLLLDEQRGREILLERLRVAPRTPHATRVRARLLDL